MRTLLFIFLASVISTGKVYVSKSGTKYHTHQDCQYIKGHDNISSITLADAQKQGKTICSRCKAKDEKAKKGEKK